MVAHLVHKDADGKLAVGRRPAQHRTVQQACRNALEEPSAQKEKENAPEAVQVNAADLLPSKTGAYYTFTGSLTTPPCSEGVTGSCSRAHVGIQERSGPVRKALSDERAAGRNR
jgi:carbonic anhydrase